MTIDISNNNPRISYTVAAGFTKTTFTVPFEFFSDFDLKVYVNGFLKRINSDYTVTGGDGSTGTITMSVVGPATVVLARDTTIERVTDFTAGVDINRAALNTQLDTLTAISADIKGKTELSIHVEDLEVGTNLTLPSVADRAEKILMFDRDGNISVAGEDALGNVTIGANYTTDNFTGDGSTTAFTLTVTPNSKSNTQVHVDGAYQNKDTYSLIDNILTLSTAPTLNASIEVVSSDAVSESPTLTLISVSEGVPYLDGNQILMDRPKKRKIVAIADLQPIPYETRGSDDGNGPVLDQVQIVRDILSEVKVHNPDVNHIVLGGDLIDGAPPSLADQAKAVSESSYVYGFEHLVPDVQTTAVAHISPISGNHDRDYREITERDRQEQGDPFYNYGTWFQKKFYYEIWGNFIHIYMGDMGGGPYGDDEGAAGIIPDYVFDWYKQVVENHKGFIPIVFTHQWLYDTGMATSSNYYSGQFIRLSDRFKDHMDNYPIPLWFSGHTMGDTATQVGDMHNFNATLGTLFVNMGVHVPNHSVTDLTDLTYPILSVEDGSNIGQITRWDHIAQDYVAAGAVSVTFPHKARLASVPDFDGRHQVSKFDPIEGKRTTIRSMEIDTTTGAMLTGPYWMEDYIVDDRSNADSPEGVEVGNLFQAPMGLEEDPEYIPDTDEGVHSYGVVAALTGRRTSSGDSVSSGELVGYASGTGKTDASLVEVFSAKNDASLHVVGSIHAGDTLYVNSGGDNLTGLFESNDSGATITLVDSDTSDSFLAEHGLNAVGDQLEVRAMNNIAFETDHSEKARLNAEGYFLVGKTLTDTSADGVELQPDGVVAASVDSGIVMVANRNGIDGQVIAIRHDGITEGNISVSGTTVSYNGGHLARWAQTADNTRIDGLLKGTVLTNLDQMAVWGDEDNEQLNCLAISSVEGDPDVAGVFVNWDDDDEVYTADMNIAMTGDMIIRIAQGTTVQRGDLLMSAGDGTAKPQGDDIVRSKTIAKVTSTHVSNTYDDGSYCVPCVLMAC